MLRTILLLLINFAIAATLAHAEPLPPPQRPADAQRAAAPQGPVLLPPQNEPAAQQPNAAAATPQKKGKPPEFFAARRQAQIDRKQAAKQRMYEFKAAQAERDEKLYQDWHERYLADVPVRVEYYRAQARAYEAEAALAYSTPYYYAAGPPIFLPVIPIYAPSYAPLYPAPIYGTTFFWGW